MKHILGANIIAQTELLRVIAKLLIQIAASDRLHCIWSADEYNRTLREIDNNLQKARNEERTDE